MLQQLINKLAAVDIFKQIYMKKIIATAALVGILLNGFAQEEDKKEESRSHGFKKENIFTGGNVIVSFSNYTTVLGGSPVIGYSITNWLDAGLQFNYTYSSNRHVTYYDPYYNAYYITDDKQRQTTFGPGAFLKIYPVKFLYLQAQGEFNATSIKFYPANNGPVEKYKVTAPSFLAGAGYCNGREGTGSLFYYFSVMVDLARDENSPYTQVDADGRIKLLPIIRAGLQIPLFQGKDARRY